MAKGSRYWDRAWSLVDGCTHVSPGCDHCWSEEMYGRFHKDCLISPEKKWTGEIICNQERLGIPLRTNKPTVFAVWNDLAHESVPDSFRRFAYNQMQSCRQHTYLVLTKRIHELVYSLRNYIYFPNERHFRIFPGVTVCTQEEADKNVPELLRLKEFFPWMKVWVSMEPMLEEIKLKPAWIRAQRGCSGRHHGIGTADCPRELHHHHDEFCGPRLDQVVIGGETGSPKKVRPIKEYWLQRVVYDCVCNNLPVFVKQMGTYWARQGRGQRSEDRGQENKTPYQLRDHQGADMRYWPESLRVRELIWR